MTAIKVIQHLLEDEPVARTWLGQSHACCKAICSEAAKVVQMLVADDLPAISEASVHLPRRGRVWVASFTGPQGGQIWRSTGKTDRAEALVLAKRWEAEARARRARLVGTSAKPVWRVRSGAGMTQAEVAQFMRISVRAVREGEKRAIRKLLANPVLRQLWLDYSAHDLDEDDLRLTAAEIAALFSLARNEEELRLIEKVLRLARADT